MIRRTRSASIHLEYKARSSKQTNDLTSYGDLQEFGVGSPLHKDGRPLESGIRLLEIKRNGTQASGKGPADWFTGAVRIDPLFQAPDPARVAGASVTFEPGARTAWHTHPLGQTLIVTAGCGRAQREGGRSRRSGRAMWSGFRRERSIGMGRRRRRR